MTATVNPKTAGAPVNYLRLENKRYQSKLFRTTKYREPTDKT